MARRRCSTSPFDSETATSTRAAGSHATADRRPAFGSHRPRGFIIPAVHRGILGGTFDPPHLAHLVAGETAYRELGLDVVTFIPAGSPWQKEGTTITDAVHRWEMVRLAIAGVEYFEADDREIRREGWTYSIDTVASFPASERLTLIVGADAAAGLPTWHRFEELLTQVGVAVYPRPGTSHDEVEDAIGGSDHVWLDAPELDIEATALRHRVATDDSVRFLVRDGVWDYIIDQGLYRDE